MNEVLRRKLFNKVMNANQPAGILASSPEMVETVQRRANGGGIAANTSPRRVIAGQQMYRQTGGIPTQLPTQIPVVDSGPNLFQRLFDARALKDARMFQGAPEGKQAFGDYLTTAQYDPEGAAIARTSVGETMSGIMDAIPQGLRNALYDTITLQPTGPKVDELSKPAPGDSRASRVIKDSSKIPGPTDIVRGIGQGINDAAQYAFVDAPYSGRPDADQLNASQRGMSMEDAAGGANAESAPSAAELKKLASEELAETVVQQSNSIAETAAVEKPPANQGGSKVPPTVAASKAMTKKLIARMDAILNNGDLSATPSISKADASKPGTFSAFSNLTATLPKEVDLEGVDKLVKDSLGFDPDQASEDKQGAFWNSVIQAGLNIAAGESSNALTNVAKGLSFGFDTYGKQIGKITDQERADRKEAGMLRLTLINSEKASNVAAAAADTQFKIAIAGAEDTAAQNAITNAYAGQRLEIAALGALATATNQQGSLDVDIYNAETSRLLAKSKETGLDALKSSGLMNSDGSFTEEGLRLLEQTGKSKNTVLTSALTATLGGTDNSGVKQVGSYTPERYVQMVLSNADTKSEMSDQMIETLPQFTSVKPPSDGEIGQYALQQLTKALAPTSVTDLTTPK